MFRHVNADCGGWTIVQSGANCQISCQARSIGVKRCAVNNAEPSEHRGDF